MNFNISKLQYSNFYKWFYQLPIIIYLIYQNWSIQAGSSVPRRRSENIERFSVNETSGQIFQLNENCLISAM